MTTLVALIALDDVERTYVAHVLDHCAGNRTAAAKILHIDRKTLSRKLRTWGDPRQYTTVSIGSDS